MMMSSTWVNWARTLVVHFCLLTLSGCAGYEYGNPGNFPPMTAAPHSIALRAAYCDDVFRDERAINQRMRIGGTWGIALGGTGLTAGTALLVIGKRSESGRDATTAGEVALIASGAALIGGAIALLAAPAHKEKARRAAKLSTDILSAAERRSETISRGAASLEVRLKARDDLNAATEEALSECFDQRESSKTK